MRRRAEGELSAGGERSDPDTGTKIDKLPASSMPKSEEVGQEEEEEGNQTTTMIPQNIKSCSLRSLDHKVVPDSEELHRTCTSADDTRVPGRAMTACRWRSRRVARSKLIRPYSLIDNTLSVTQMPSDLQCPGV